MLWIAKVAKVALTVFGGVLGGGGQDDNDRHDCDHHCHHCEGGHHTVGQNGCGRCSGEHHHGGRDDDQRCNDQSSDQNGSGHSGGGHGGGGHSGGGQYDGGQYGGGQQGGGHQGDGHSGGEHCSGDQHDGGKHGDGGHHDEQYGGPQNGGADGGEKCDGEDTSEESNSGQYGTGQYGSAQHGSGHCEGSQHGGGQYGGSQHGGGHYDGEQSGVEQDSGPACIELDFGCCYQKISGFGGSMAYYQNWVTEHPRKDQILGCLYKELRPSIIRFRNSFDLCSDGVSSDMKCDAELYLKAQQNMPQAPLVILAAWSPPARFKKSGITKGGVDGTIICPSDEGPERFKYNEVAQWWMAAYNEYEKMGIDVWGVSVQNEINFSGDHDCCLFSPSERDDIPGYDRYLKATRSLFHCELTSPPIFVGPEHTEMDGLLPEGDLGSNIDVVANHLYGSGDFNSPETLLPCIKNAGQWAVENRKTIFMSEYTALREHEHEDPLKMATTMHNCLVHGNISAYLQWDLFWGAGTGQGALLVIDNPFDSHDKFCNPDGFTVTSSFWWFAQFSRFIRPGYSRVEARVNKGHLLVSAYSGPGANFCIVVINTSCEQVENVGFRGLPGGARDSRCFQSTLDSCLRDVGEFDGTLRCLPPRSITTVSTVTQ